MDPQREIRRVLTNGEAAGPSRIASSSRVNDILGITNVLRGSNSMMITGNPIAASDVKYINKKVQINGKEVIYQ